MAVSDEVAEVECFGDFLPEERVFEGKLVPQAVDFFEGPGIRDGGSGVIGNHSEPRQPLLFKWHPGEDGGYAEYLAVVDERLPAKPAHAFASDPIGIAHPILLRVDLEDFLRFSGLGNPSDFARANGYPAGTSIDLIPDEPLLGC